MNPEWMPPLQPLPNCAYTSLNLEQRNLLCQWADANALAAVEAYKASLTPVAYLDAEWGSLHKADICRGIKAFELVPLYRLDGGDDDAA